MDLKEVELETTKKQFLIETGMHMIVVLKHNVKLK